MLLLYLEIVNIFVLNSETNIFQNIKQNWYMWCCIIISYLIY